MFNPATSLDALKYVMDKVDMVLLMSVNPGFGGQKFIPGTLDKLREARALIDASGRDIRLEIDGGVNVNNIREIAAAGADTFVAGSAIFNARTIRKSSPRCVPNWPRPAHEWLRAAVPGTLPRLVMFDLDGTLIDSVPDLAAAVDRMLLELGRPPAGLEAVRHWVGNGAQILVRRALAGGIEHEDVDDALAEKGLALFMDAYAEHHELTVLYPGVKDTLRWLQKQGVEMALITNKPERFVAPLLDQMKIGRYFRWIIGGDTLPQKSPTRRRCCSLCRWPVSARSSRCSSAIRAAMCWRPKRPGCNVWVSPTATTMAGRSPRNPQPGGRRPARSAAWLRRPGHWDNVGGPSSLPRQRVHRGGHWQILDESHQGPGPLALARLTHARRRLPARPLARPYCCTPRGYP